MTASDVEKTAAAESTSPSAKNASSPTKAEGGEDKRKEAMNHFVAGKRHLLVKDLNAAVTSLALACELMSAEYGETAYECADAYYYYGKALLEMARAESGVFGNALDGVPDGEDTDNSQVEDPDKMTEEERDDVEKKVGEALDENFSVLQEKKEMREKRAESTEEETGDESPEDEEEKETTEEKSEEAKDKEPEKDKETKSEASKKDEKESEKEAEKEKDAEMETDEAKDKADAKDASKNEKEKEAKDEESVGDGDVDAKEGKDKQEQEAEDEEDPSNLQLSWEMLELAKVAYTNQLEKAKEAEKKVVEIKICEVLLTLGEVSLESETYEQAVADITECLTKRKVLYEADSRRIAETHYHLGVALGHHNKFDEAVSALQEAIACIKLRIGNLKEEKESKDESKADDAFYTREAEITELEALIPEIEEKIQDTKDMKEQSSESQAEESTGFANGEAAKSAKPISTISVKRKAEGSDSVSPKKAHVAENGDEK